MDKKNKYFIQDGMISKFDFMANQEFYPLPTLCNLLNKQDEQYDNLAKKFVIMSKALELACDCFYANFGKVLEPYCGITSSPEAMANYYINKAKEMIENE